MQSPRVRTLTIFVFACCLCLAAYDKAMPAPETSVKQQTASLNDDGGD